MVRLLKNNPLNFRGKFYFILQPHHLNSAVGRIGPKERKEKVSPYALRSPYTVGKSVLGARHGKDGLRAVASRQGLGLSVGKTSSHETTPFTPVIHNLLCLNIARLSCFIPTNLKFLQSLKNSRRLARKFLYCFCFFFVPSRLKRSSNQLSQTYPLDFITDSLVLFEINFARCSLLRDQG